MAKGVPTLLVRNGLGVISVAGERISPRDFLASEDLHPAKREVAADAVLCRRNRAACRSCADVSDDCSRPYHARPLINAKRRRA